MKLIFICILTPHKNKITPFSMLHFMTCLVNNVLYYKWLNEQTKIQNFSIAISEKLFPKLSRRWKISLSISTTFQNFPKPHERCKNVARISGRQSSCCLRSKYKMPGCWLLLNEASYVQVSTVTLITRNIRKISHCRNNFENLLFYLWHFYSQYLKVSHMPTTQMLESIN